MEEFEAYQRRLPIYLLIDCSQGMEGAPIQAIEDGINSFVNDLKGDPIALESVWLGVLTFATVAKVPVPLTELSKFQLPHLEAQGATALGDAIRLLLRLLETDIRKTSPTQKGDWKPMVYIFTDGDPTDEWEADTQDLRQRNLAKIIVCGAGHEVKEETLKLIGDKALKLRDTSPGTLKSFMEWVSASIAGKSRILGTFGSAEMEPDLPEDIVIVK